MVTKDELIAQAYLLGFSDIGFTTAEPFESQRQILNERSDSYHWTQKHKLDLWGGLEPKSIWPPARSIIVLVHNYYHEAFPPQLMGKFGRCYLDDDRVTRDGLTIKLRQFRAYLQTHEIESKVPPNLPQRLSAARAGLGTFGKNCLFYSRQAANRGSWITLTAILVNREFDPDPPSIAIGCPDWCRNACIAACPTGALRGPGKIEPRRCVSYLSYFSEEITPREFREPMGTWVYGCDRCQNVCPRNQSWLQQQLPLNARVVAKAPYFDLLELMRMDVDHFKNFVWPHMFYTDPKDIWRWKMNVARAMGNSLDPAYVPVLVEAYWENEDERVRGMIAWALGRLGTGEARRALEEIRAHSTGMVKEEAESALAELG